MLTLIYFLDNVFACKIAINWFAQDSDRLYMSRLGVSNFFDNYSYSIFQSVIFKYGCELQNESTPSKLVVNTKR